MKLSELLGKSNEFVDFLNKKIDLIEIENTIKNRAAGACQHLSLEHHASILLLLAHQQDGSASALVRSQLESYVRGVWLYHCATDYEIDSLLKDKLNPGFGSLVEKIEKLDVFKQGALSKLKKESWSGLCSYAHSGGLQVTRRNTSEEITNNYSDDEKIEMIDACNLFALLSSSAISEIAKNDQLANDIYTKYKLLFRRTS